MTLFILDPNLDRDNGHHLEWDLAIARAAQARGETVVIYAHRDFPAEQAGGVAIRPWFSFTTYARAAHDPVAGRYDDFHLFNETLAADLAALPPENFRVGDAVLAPTLNENHLLGYATWMKGFDQARAPLFMLHLMFDTGLGGTGADGDAVVGDPLTALFYRLGQRKAAEPGPEIHLFATGRQLARDYSSLFARSVPPHPVPLAPARAAPRPEGGRPTCLLFAGDAKPDKGVLLLPGLLQAIAAGHPDWDVLLHVNDTTAWGAARKACADLAAIAAQLPNVTLRTGRLPREEYLRLMEAADLMVCTHEPGAYARKSSGIVWEALGLGLPMVVPANCWLEREAADWGAGAVTAPAWSINALAGAFDAARRQRPALAERSAEAARRFLAANGAGALMDEIWGLWRPSLGAQAMPEPLSPPAPGAAAARAAPDSARGAAQWMGHVAELSFAWPPGEAWQLEVDTGAHVSPVDVGVEPGAAAGTARIVASADGRDNRDGQVRLRVSLARAGRAPVIAPPAAQPPARAEAEAEAEAQPPAFRTGRGSDAVQAARVTLDELHEGETYRHLDLSLHGLAFGAESWERVKFKICRDREARHLEFRRMHGWPEMFVEWPGTEYDQYGEVLHVPVDGSGLTLREPRDRALLGALARGLKDAVACLRAQDPARAETLDGWVAEAELHQRGLAAGLRAMATEAAGD